ncbi:Chaperone protein DnaJ [Diplonema papillatum]|nr:Chaperone protein DnaJ [Diplonema papillatum]
MRRARVLLCTAARQPTFKKSPHGVLGVERTASPEEVKAAYQKLVAEHHPDKGGDAEEFQRIREAYDAVMHGAPAYMVYGRDDEPDLKEKSETWARAAVDRVVGLTGHQVHWEKVVDPYNMDRHNASTGRKVVILGSVYWFLFAVQTPRPLYLFILYCAYWWDRFTNGVVLIGSFVFLLWWSLYTRQVDGFFGRSYWAFDQPNALTVAYGIPDFSSSKMLVAQNRTEGYSHLLAAEAQRIKKQNAEKKEAKSAMQRTVDPEHLLMEHGGKG